MRTGILGGVLALVACGAWLLLSPAVDVNGIPIEGVAVSIVRWREIMGGAQVWSHSSWTPNPPLSDALGRFEVPLPHPGAFELRTSRGGYRSVVTRIDTEESQPDSIRFRLEYDHPIEGRLVDAAGRPIQAWLEVTTLETRGFLDTSDPGPLAATTTTDAAGRFLLAPLSGGRTELIVHPVTDCPVPPVQVVDVPFELRPRLDLCLDPAELCAASERAGTTLHVQVHERPRSVDGGITLALAEPDAVFNQGSPESRAPDEHGRVLFRGVPAGPRLLVVTWGDGNMRLERIDIPATPYLVRFCSTSLEDR